MGKARFLINKDELKKELLKLETDRSFKNWNELFEACSKVPWALKQKKSDGTTKPLTAAVIALRVKEFKIELKTPKGKKGSAEALKKGRDLKKLPKEERFKQKAGYLLAVNKLKALFKGEKYKKILDGILKGNPKAISKGVCLTCCNFQMAEITSCKNYHCPNYLPSPYTGRKQAEIDQEEKDEEKQEEVVEKAKSYLDLL